MSVVAARMRDGTRGGALLGLLAAAVLAVSYVAAEPTRLRTALAVGLVLLAAAIGLVWPQRLLYGLAGWLVVLGLVRRLVTLVAPADGPDPLLVVEPAAVAILLLAVARPRLAVRRSPLAACVLALSVVILASAFNPRQGSLAVGVAGLLFLLVPTAGFWIGRTLADRVFARVLGLLALLALPVAAYGLFQTFVRLPRWDELWLLQAGGIYQALAVGGQVRAFSTLPSFAEYAYVLAVAVAVWLAFGLRPARLPATLAAVALIGTALVLASVRLVVFLLAAALVAMAASRLRVNGAVAGMVALLGLLGTSALVGRLAPDAYATGATGALLSHQLEGLSQPLDPHSSTLFLHLSLVTEGVRFALSHPLGLGAGSVSLAASKFGGVGLGTEADPSNLAVAAGLLGLLLYCALAVLAFVRAYCLARARRDALSLSALAIVTVVFLQWFNGGQYGIALLFWLTLGWIDRSSLRLGARGGGT